MIASDQAPVCLFVFKRLAPLKKCISSLQANYLAPVSDLHIFSDAAAKPADIKAVKAVRHFICGIRGFRSVTVHQAEYNCGLAQSIINGVTRVINKTGKVIVLEDDLVTSPNFLNFMNGALMAYEKNPLVYAASGYTSPIKTDIAQDIFFTRRSSSWGWATWKDRWNKIDWGVADFNDFESDEKKQRLFNAMGSDLSQMLKKQMAGKINSWAIRWVYHQFKYDLYTVFPIISKVKNEGFNEDGTNTFHTNESRFATVLDEGNQTTFDFFPEPYLNDRIIEQFIKPYTVRTRILYKIKSLLNIS